MGKIKIKINGKPFEANEGQTILEVARAQGIDIPTLCHHPDFPAKGNCRVCVVEIAGWPKLATACSTKVSAGMDISTESERVAKSRNMNIELIFAEHIEKCPTCIWKVNCPLLAMAEKYGLKINRFKDRKSKRNIEKFSNAVEIDHTQCIDCGNCVEACGVLQNINYLKFSGKGPSQRIESRSEEGFKCILCGQCALHCPVSAAQEQAQWNFVESDLKKEGKIMVAQFAPSIRVSIGEEFGLPAGEEVSGKVVAALRKLGFDHVFDVNFAADLTTVVEAEELLERLKDKEGEKSPMPMFTSCCPGWVNYIELYHPELIPNLTTARSPHIHNGGVIKTYWADKMGVKPSQIEVVSIMPCTAKKYEASRKEMKVKGSLPVDKVMTNRELAWLIKKSKIDFAGLEPEKADDPLGEYSGGAAIFGGTGGVMESALRAAHSMACGNKKTGICQKKIDFKEARGLKGIKEATVEVAGIKLRIAIVNGIGNVEPILRNLESYDYVEVMACPGGCIGGGGQPIPTTPEIRKKRIDALYELDKNSKLRRSDENKKVKEVLAWLKEKGHKLEHSVLHTKYNKKNKC
ncbi:2Fe-2S iron-sulfur cluster binding domain-containing protein [Candidatus Falkowbacteria bacterium]|nr:2Fe-2S iron-sulfur cluster binding domain-containing protein [Candidatus Falkowbacteria bacterium]